MAMPSVKLRGHHLLCMLSYVGHGYTKEFVTNFNTMMERLNKGASIELVAGPDDICAALQKNPMDAEGVADHCTKARNRERDQTALLEINQRIMKLDVGETVQLNKRIIERMRKDFHEGKIRGACQGCDWHSVCTTVASNNYDGVVLKIS